MFASRTSDDGVVPIHYVFDSELLLGSGRWSFRALEKMIGRPGRYPTHTVRLYVVAPERPLANLYINDVQREMEQYALTHNLSVKIVYYPAVDLEPVSLYFNYDESGVLERQRISIDLIGSEAVTGMWLKGANPVVVLLEDMHLRAFPSETIIELFAIERYVKDKLTYRDSTFGPGTEFDFTHLRVHRRLNGKHVSTDFPIIAPDAE